MEEITFETLLPKEVRVTLGTDKFTLREASGSAGLQFRAARQKCFKRNDKGEVSEVTGLEQTEALLVSLCLFDAEDKPVPEAVVTKWPYKVQRALYVKATKISYLVEEDTLEELIKERDELNKRIEELQKDNNPLKNSPGDTPTG